MKLRNAIRRVLASVIRIVDRPADGPGFDRWVGVELPGGGELWDTSCPTRDAAQAVAARIRSQLEAELSAAIAADNPAAVPVFAPDDARALQFHLRVAWQEEFLRYFEAAVRGGWLPAPDDDVEAALQMVAEVRRLNDFNREQFPDPALSDAGQPVHAASEIPF